jgi:hypothetical protein
MQTIEPGTRQLERDAEPRTNGDAPTRHRSGPRTLTVGDVLRWLVAGLLAGSAAIHFAMMGEHAGVSWTHGTFFGIVAWVQLVLAVGIVWQRARWVAGTVIVANVAVLTVWLVTRTVGLAIGGDGTPEDWGTIDGVCAALEGAAILGCVGLLAPGFARRPVSAEVGRGSIAVVGVAIAALVTFVFSPAWAGGSGDGHAHADGGESAASASGGVATTADDGHAHEHGPVALNGQKITGVKAQDIAAETQPDQPLDAATRSVLKSQLVAARDLALRYPTVADATAAGYYLAGGFAPGSGAHYIAPNGGLSGLRGGFDPTAVNSLIYTGTAPTSEIAGLMYYAIGNTPTEGFAGPNDHWHRHSNVCIAGGTDKLEVPFPADADVTRKQCEAAGGGLMEMTGWMVHAWVVPSWESPQGVFSHDNPNVRCADGTYKTNKAGFCQGV